MTLEEMINNSLKDENVADDDYEVMIEATNVHDKLAEEEKSLVMGILFKIKTDEETHQILLKIIKELLDSKVSNK